MANKNDTAPTTPIEAARSRELVADAMRRFAAEDINPVVRGQK